MKILIVVEHNNQAVKDSTYHTLTAAQQLGGEIDFLVVGDSHENVIKGLSCFKDVKRILVAKDTVYAHQLAENSAKLIAEIGTSYQYILAPATTFGKNLLPRVAALLDVALIADVIKIISSDTFERPLYAGNVIATVKTEDPIKLLTIRTTAFPAALPTETITIPVEKLAQIIPNAASEFVDHALSVSERPELTSARVIISGGRGLKSAENFKLLEHIADQLGAALGASRAAVDAGFAPNDYQVGQTGKVVAPELYIAVGISGAIQHLAGMKDSKVIVAINNDAEAPIFEVADYGLVGDLFTVLPELSAALEKT